MKTTQKDTIHKIYKKFNVIQYQQILIESFKGTNA